MNHPFTTKKFAAITMTLVLALVMLLATSGSAKVQEKGRDPGRNVATAPSQQQGPTDRAEMEAFMEKLLGREMKKHHIAGAAVSVVKDGKLFFAKGYGTADLENGIPVDPERTNFRIGSVAKLFTWTAIMQLAEQGKTGRGRSLFELRHGPCGLHRGEGVGRALRPIRPGTHPEPAWYGAHDRPAYDATRHTRAYIGGIRL
jgi:hypothetical protein